LLTIFGPVVDARAAALLVEADRIDGKLQN
jgi:hypothetical protein